MAPIAATAAVAPSPSAAAKAAARLRQHPVGAVATSSRVDFSLVLKLRDAAGAQALLKAVSTPGSASYRHYLSTAQWEARFSPSASAVSRARNWLRGQGFAVGAVSKDRITIDASGTAAQVEKAFGTGLGYYRVRGHVVRLTTGSASVPAAIKGVSVGAMGLDQTFDTPAVASAANAPAATAASARKGKFPPPPSAFLPAPPCGSYYNQKITTVTPPFGNGYPSKVPYEVCGYKPGQFRSVYNVGSDTGKGATVAIVDAYSSATIAQDATHYFKLNDPGNPFSNAHLTEHLSMPFTNEEACGDWSTEQAIDVESVHSVARDAHILFVGAKSCSGTDLFKADQYVIDNDAANALTNSFGDPSGDVLDSSSFRAANDDIFQLAGTTGISVMFSTGDDGDNYNLTGISAPSYPASSPYVTAVGGTSLQIGASGKQIGELGWSTGRSFKCTKNAVNALCTKSQLNHWLPVTYDGGSGGYTSYNYREPYYQKAAVPSALANRNAGSVGIGNVVAPARVIPDISLDADPSTGFLIGLTETFSNGKVGYNQPRYGGTSLASPLLAGLIADIDGASQASGRADVGFINPAIYRLNGDASAIYDVVPGGKQGQLRVDHAFTYLGPSAKGVLYSFRELTYEGPISYCDGTGNCETRDNTLTTAKGYDSMTGLGSPGPSFLADMSGP